MSVGLKKFFINIKWLEKGLILGRQTTGKKFFPESRI